MSIQEVKDVRKPYADMLRAIAEEIAQGGRQPSGVSLIVYWKDSAGGDLMAQKVEDGFDHASAAGMLMFMANRNLSALGIQHVKPAKPEVDDPPPPVQS